MSKITTLHTFQDGSRLIYGDFFLIKQQNQNTRMIGCCGVFHISKSGRVLNRFNDSELNGFSFKLFKIVADDGVVLVFASNLDCAEYYLDRCGYVIRKNIFKITRQSLLASAISTPRPLE
jgi:hypothetical protein